MKTRSVISAIVVLLICAGWVVIHTLEFQPLPLPATTAEQKIPLSVALVLDKPFVTYGVVVQRLDGPTIFQVGNQLRSAAIAVSQAAFKSVTVFDSVEAAANKADLILIPKLERSNFWAGPTLRLLLSEQWEVKNGKADRTVWVGTFDAESQTSNGFSKQPREILFSTAVNQLDEKSLKALSESPEIKALATKARTSSPSH
jgi:hypothetical protein